MTAFSAADSHAAQQTRETTAASLTLVPSPQVVRSKPLSRPERKAFRKAALEAEFSEWY